MDEDPPIEDKKVSGVWTDTPNRLKYTIQEGCDLFLFVERISKSKWEFDIYQGDKYVYRFKRKDYMGIKNPSSQIYKGFHEVIEEVLPGNGIDLKRFLGGVEVDISTLLYEKRFQDNYQLDRFLELPDWEIDGGIYSLVRVEKAVEEKGEIKKVIRLIKLYYDPKTGWLSRDLLTEKDSAKFIPSDPGYSLEGSGTLQVREDHLSGSKPAVSLTKRAIPPGYSSAVL